MAEQTTSSAEQIARILSVADQNTLLLAFLTNHHEWRGEDLSLAYLTGYFHGLRHARRPNKSDAEAIELEVAMRDLLKERLTGPSYS